MLASAAFLLAAQKTRLRSTESSGAALGWSAAEIGELRKALLQAPRYGLNAETFLSHLDRASDADLTRVAENYASALSIGLVDPREIHGIFTLRMNQTDVASGLATARAAGRIGPWLDGLAPQDAEFRALSQECLRRIASAARGPLEDIRAGGLIRPGDRDARVGAIAARLRERGVLPYGEAIADVYGPDLEAAVRRLQRDAGLRLDGVIGPETLGELNQGPVDRARQIALNLERRRWLARRPPKSRIDVNVARAELTYIRDGAPVRTARVVAGAVTHKTPLLGDRIRRLVVNPPWHVPRSIARAEILPKGAAYLRSHNMSLEGGRIVQRPGPGSALGRIKFDMDNRYAIYLHDTPAKALFEASYRLRSHGCVRVEDAVGLARQIAADRGRLQPFEEALSSGETRAIDLGAPLPVRLLYLTADADDSGAVRFTQDDYGWDTRLAQRMGLGPGRMRARLAMPADLLGP